MKCEKEVIDWGNNIGTGEPFTPSLQLVLGLNGEIESGLDGILIEGISVSGTAMTRPEFVLWMSMIPAFYEMLKFLFTFPLF